MKIRTRLLHGHTKTQFDHYHEWVMLGDHCYRDTLGRRNGGFTRWLIAICNDPDCGAKALVNSNDVERAATRALPQR